MNTKAINEAFLEDMEEIRRLRAEIVRLRARSAELYDALSQATSQLERDHKPTPLNGRRAFIRKLNDTLAKATP